jgi:serine/threonine protein kinase
MVTWFAARHQDLARRLAHRGAHVYTCCSKCVRWYFREGQGDRGMTDPPPTTRWPFPPEQARQVGQACNAFEAAWQTGQRPRIEDHLGDLPEPARTALLRELLRRELAYRRAAGEQPAATDYEARFPDLRDWIAGQLEPTASAETGTPETLPPFEPPVGPAGTWPAVPGYEVLSELGRGGMGVVYKARQKSLNRTVALKMILAGAHASADQLRRFRRETEALARLQHPNIVAIYAVEEHEQLPYFAMEFCAGGSLKKRLRSQALPPDEAARLVETLARAVLHAAHDAEIVHRDLKPDNVLFTADGLAKISDFGLAKQLDASRFTPNSAVLGTPSYMAPEMVGQHHQVGRATDVYGLGAILYELLTGRPPFQGLTPMDVLAQVLADEPVPPSRLRRGVPDGLEAVCLHCLEKRPEARYPTAAALADDLRRVAAGEPPSVQTLSELERLTRWAQAAGFEILDVLTYGVRDVVCKARQVDLDRLVALKVLTAREEEEPDARARLRTEAERLARLHHPNIVTIYSSSRHGGRAYLAYEFVDGGSLVEKYRDEPAAPRLAAQLLLPLAEAIHHAHEHGIVHGALKPSSVLLAANDVPKVTNFGPSFLVEEERAGLARRPAFRRLPSYMAPELADGRAEEIGPAVDVYALGAVLYKLLTGGPPFLADSVQATLEQVRAQEPVPPHEWNPDVPPQLEAVCLKCLRKRPGDRYATAQALADELRHYLAATEEVDILPGYVLLNELPRGGLGVVYKSRQKTPRRLVALKIYNHRWEHFRMAQRAAAGLEHPNLVRVYDAGEHGGRLYAAEEFIEGNSLAQRLAGGARLPPQGAAQLLGTLAKALHHVHEHGLVHGNLKPPVVLFTKDDVPKVSSFDLARVPGEGPENAEGSGQRSGTPAYMAPEQVTGAARLDRAVDVHALGVLLYEMLTGCLPFQGVNRMETLKQIERHEPVSPAQLRPDVPGDLAAVCLLCLRKEPARRYATAQALAEDLRRFLDGQPVLARSGLWKRVTGWLRPGS